MFLKSVIFYVFVFGLVTCGLSFRIDKVDEEVVTYVGAVIEFEPYTIWDDNKRGYGVLQKNIKAVSSAAEIAKLQHADILVAPEYGLTSLSTHAGDFSRFFTYTTYIPNPSDKVVPCDSAQSDLNIDGLKLLSCTAKQESIYLVVNMIEAHPCTTETITSAPWSAYDADNNCPDSGFYFHNSEVVIDRSGAIIARYRKIHLFNEDNLTPGSANDDDTAIFVTDFNVTFSLQICFDIGFEDPAYKNVREKGIKNVISSTAWVDYLPFNSADLTQDAWSKGLKVNLLISGYHLPEESKMGSGIYRQLFDESPIYVYDKDSGNVLLVGEIKTTVEGNEKSKPAKSLRKLGTKTLDQVISLKTEEEERIHVVFHESLQEYTSVPLESGDLDKVFTADVCSEDNFCCNLTYQYTGNLTYKLVALKGQFVVGGRYHIGVQNCAVLWCKTDSIKSCGVVDRNGYSDKFGPFNLSSSSYTIDSVFPGGGYRDLTLINHELLHYTNEGQYYELSTSQPIRNFFGASLFGRWYANDGA